MTYRLYRVWAGLAAWLVAATCVVASCVVASLQAEESGAPLVIRRAGDGTYRLETSADIGLVVFEQAESLVSPVTWLPAVVGADGTLVAALGTRFYRWRLVDSPAFLVRRIVPFEFAGAPTEVVPGERVNFDWSGIPLDPQSVRWRVDPLDGSPAPLGEISATGDYTAPSDGLPRRVAVIAEADLGAGRVALGRAELVVRAAEPSSGPRLLTPSIGGVVFGPGGRGRLEVPGGAVDKPQTWSIEVLPASRLADVDEPGRVALAVLELKPDGVEFSRPVKVSFPLDRWVPGGRSLRLHLGRAVPEGLVWEDSGIEAAVDPGGFSATADLPHFSTWAVLEPRASDPTTTQAPRVDPLAPLSMREGELRPFLLKGAGFETVARVTIHDDPTTGPFASNGMEVREFAASPGECAVVIKSLPDPTLPAGARRQLRLRLAVNASVSTEVPLTVSGLDEFILARGVSAQVPADPPTNRAIFSRIEIQAGARLQSLARALAWQATDSVVMAGTVTAAGPDGPPGRQADPGRMPEPDRTRTGAGDGQRASPWTPLDGTRPNGIPWWTVNLAEFLPDSESLTFGAPGDVGFDRGVSGAIEVLPAVDEAMYRLYGRTVNQWIDSPDPGRQEHLRAVAAELTERHPGGRKGHQGVPGGFTPRIPLHGFHPRSRRIEAGGGGGGGGGSYRASAFVDGDVAQIGLGGGAGGGGGGAISLVAGSVLAVEADAIVDTSGGDGGDGGLPATLGAPLDLWPHLGRGGGGGPGGAGTLHLLAGERLENPSMAWPVRHRAGEWGQGGFLMVVQSHPRVTPPSWWAPHELDPSWAQAEMSGPDFTSAGAGLRTGIRFARAVHAHALNPRFQAVSVRVSNRSGQHSYPLRGVSAARRDVRFLLEPGTNLVQVSDLADHAVLDREIVVLESPDTDGDGLTDAEEAESGYDPTTPDTDGDGIPDGTEWLSGGRGVPGDSDGDGVPDSTEREAGSDPEDPSSTPWNAQLGSGNALAMVVSWPSALRVIRPAFEGTPAVGPGVTVAGPGGVRVVRPATSVPGGLPWGTVGAVPRSIRVVWE